MPVCKSDSGQRNERLLSRRSLPPRRDALDIFGFVRRFIGVIAVALEVRAAFVEIDRHDRRRIHFGGIAPPFGKHRPGRNRVR